MRTLTHRPTCVLCGSHVTRAAVVAHATVRACGIPDVAGGPVCTDRAACFHRIARTITRES